MNNVSIFIILVSSLIIGCMTPPLRTSFSGAPGRHHTGDGEIGIAGGVTISNPDNDSSIAIGELTGAYGIADQWSVEIGGVGGAVEGGFSFMGGFAGLKITLPRGFASQQGVYWDLELGGGGGGLLEEDGHYYGGSYTGVGVAYRWQIIAIYGRFRVQTIGDTINGFSMWNSIAAGNEFRFGKVLNFYWSISESMYFMPSDFTAWVTAAELGLTIRL